MRSTDLHTKLFKSLFFFFNMYEKSYSILETTTSLCPLCMKRVDAKIIRKDEKIYILKYCFEHGEQLEILEEDAEWYEKRNAYTKPGTLSKIQTKREKGCPFDCGLCPEHEQHTCNALIEVTRACDLGCPVCYASSGGEAQKNSHVDLKTIEKMMDFWKESEFVDCEILQISGGEPTIHPQIIDIIRLAKQKKFKYILLNTNGLRIARDEEFVKALAEFRGRFEIYLQYDGVSSNIYKHFRGKDLLKEKLKAIENLQKYKIPITLVATIQRGINDKEIGKLIEFGMNTPYVRGINFQPIAFFGRYPKTQTDKRITMTGIIKEIEKQCPLIKKGDIIPLPCDVDRVALTYLYRTEKGVYPLTRKFKVENYLSYFDNTFAFDADVLLKKKGIRLMLSNVLCSCAPEIIQEVKSIIPENYHAMTDEERMEYWNTHIFRISISSFIDAYNIDMRSMKKECVHILTPDFKKIPFSSFNMIHRKNYKEKNL